MKRAGQLLGIVLIVAIAFAGGIWFAKRMPTRSASKDGRKILYWVDPMHPAYRSDKPGIAPDCGMKLVPVYADGGTAPATQGKVLFYRDPQNPKYTSPDPGLNPESGNQLVPVREGSAEAMPTGTINVTADKQQIIGVRFGSAELASTTNSIRVAGRVAQDETRLTR